jgi:hypothetical protein
MKTITRAKLKSGFTQVPNATIRELELSIRALGVLSFVLSFPDDWIFHVEWLATQLPDSKHVIREALRELEKKGIAKQVVEKDTRTHRIIRKYWTFTDSREPTSNFPKKAFSYVGNLNATNNVVTKNVGNEKPLGAFQPVRVYPRDEDEMMAAIEEVIGYSLTGQAETIANLFLPEMEKAEWRPGGKPIYDWMKVLFARINTTTGDNLSCDELPDVPF